MISSKCIHIFFYAYINICKNPNIKFWHYFEFSYNMIKYIKIIYFCNFVTTNFSNLTWWSNLKKKELCLMSKNITRNSYFLSCAFLLKCMVIKLYNGIICTRICRFQMDNIYIYIHIQIILKRWFNNSRHFSENEKSKKTTDYPYHL